MLLPVSRLVKPLERLEGLGRRPIHIGTESSKVFGIEKMKYFNRCYLNVWTRDSSAHFLHFFSSTMSLWSVAALKWLILTDNVDLLKAILIVKNNELYLDIVG